MTRSMFLFTEPQSQELSSCTSTAVAAREEELQRGRMELAVEK